MSALQLLVFCLSLMAFLKLGPASGLANTRTKLCRNGWAYIPGAQPRCLKFMKTWGDMSWSNAASSCEDIDATLFTIPDTDVDDALQQYVKSRAATFHIGLRYDNASWEWRWVNGKSMTYAYWATDVMDTVRNPAGKDCVAAMFDLRPSAIIKNMGRPSHAEWHPVPCDDFLASVVCEIRLDDHPAQDPSTSSPLSIGNGAVSNAACKDTSSYVCDALKAIMCNDAQYAKYVSENCAATCGLC